MKLYLESFDFFFLGSPTVIRYHGQAWQPPSFLTAEFDVPHTSQLLTLTCIEMSFARDLTTRDKNMHVLSEMFDSYHSFSCVGFPLFFPFAYRSVWALTAAKTIGCKRRMSGRLSTVTGSPCFCGQIFIAWHLLQRFCGTLWLYLNSLFSFPISYIEAWQYSFNIVKLFLLNL